MLHGGPKESSSGLRLALLALSAGAFTAACFLPVVHTRSGKTLEGGMALIFGVFTLIPDRGSWHLGWLANPLLLLGWVSLAAAKAEQKRWPLIVAALALLVALSSYLTLWEAPIQTGLYRSHVESFGHGIHLWVGSHAALFGAQLYLWIQGAPARRRQIEREAHRAFLSAAEDPEEGP